MRKITKAIAILLSVALVNTPVSATIAPPPVATETIENTFMSPSLTTTPIVISEEISLREQGAKHFQLSDGTYRAVVYDEPVHYKQGNEWIEIDNSLVPASLVGEPLTGTIKRDTELTANDKQNILQYNDNPNRTYNTAYYENNVNDFNVQLPKEINSDTPVVVNYCGHSLRFRFNSITNTVAEITQPKNATAIAQELQNELAKTADNNLRVKIQNDFAMAVQKNRSSVSYPSVKSNMDLNYYVSGQSLKEDIVFHSLPSAESFSFEFTYTGLSAVLEEDKSVIFNDESGKPVFVIAAPFMFDSDEGYSSDIQVTLEQTGTGCRYTLTPNREWLEDTERVYPVTLDPQVATTQNSSYIHDNGVQQSDPNTNYITADRMYVGSGPNSTQGRIYFKLTLWPSVTGLNANTITSATLNLSYYPQSSWQTAYQTTIDVYRVYSSWDTNTITWNNQTSISGTKISSKYISNSRNKTSGYESFDVTAWVKAHYSNPASDYGIRLQPNAVVSSTNRACFISSDYGTTTSRPVINIDYIPASEAASGITSGEIYYIRNVNSGKYLDVKNGNLEVVQCSFNRGEHQKWKVVYEADGYYSLSPVGSANKVLDLANGFTSNGNPLWSYNKWPSNTSEKNAQRFAISQIGTGKYKIAAKKDTNKVVEVRSASVEDNATVQLWDYVGQPQQQWYMEKVSDQVIYSAFSIGNDNRVAYNHFTWYLDNYPDNFIDYKKHTYLDGAIGKSSLINYLTQSDVAYIDSHGASGGSISIMNAAGDSIDTISLQNDIGKNFKSGSSTITETPFKDQTKWLIIQACSQLNYDASNPTSSAAYKWAKALLGDGNRMHGVLSYYEGAPAGNLAKDVMDDFLAEQWTEVFNMVESWQWAHPQKANWAAVFHSANKNDKLFSLPWTANTSKYSTPTIYLYRSDHNFDYEDAEIFSTNASPTYRSVNNKTLSFKSKSDFKATQTLKMIPTTITTHQQEAVRSMLNPQTEDFYQISGGSKIRFSSQSIKLTNDDASMSMSKTEAVSAAKQYLLNMNLLSNEDEYITVVSSAERLLFDMEDGTTSAPETVNYMVSFYQTYNGIPIVNADGPAIRMTLCKDGISIFEYQWQTITPDKQMENNPVLLSGENAISKYCDEWIPQCQISQDNMSVCYQQVYVVENGHSKPAYMFETDNDTILIDAVSGEIM